MICATLLMLSLALPQPFPKALAQTDGRFYAETGYTLAAQFVDFFDSHGGVPVFGYPVSEARQENGYLVQWTERQRLEWHPENAGTDYEVLLGLLGRELTKGLDGPLFQCGAPNAQCVAVAGQDRSDSAPDPQTPPGGHYFPQTGQSVSDLFYNYWQAHGGVAVFGYPISAECGTGSTECGVASSVAAQSSLTAPSSVQWFERARFEVHPENPPETRVLLGQLGNEALKERNAVDYEFDVSGTPAPDTNLEIGLSQGGESSDPAFFNNIQQTGAALGPGLVRLDNIFNYYNIVQRGPGGNITYDWTQLDQVLDGIKGMGKEPLICLSYMPETMSADGVSRVSPPADYNAWAALVSATVTHVNIDRKTGVRYWEVWNEPDQWGFWQAPFPDYLKLYDVTVQAAIAADPSIKIGGPSVSHFSPDHLTVFLQHERDMGSQGRVDFISWHSYGKPPDQIAADIRQMRTILEGFPQFSPQIFISEFNILQGGTGDTSSNGYTDTVEGAIAFLSSIESMQRERLDKAFLFELKDGQGTKSYWGRWGVLTYDGLPKPIYYALKAYQNRPSGMLPVSLKSGPTDGTLGMMAFGSPEKSTVMLWYTGKVDARIKIGMPQDFADTYFDVSLFDHDTNNPARSGDPTLKLQPPVNAGDIVLDLNPNSLVILTSR
jgi:hypothetical protein